MQWKGAAPMRSSAREVFQAPQAQPIELAAEITLHLTPFDQKEYRQLIEARGETIQRVVTRLKPALGLSNAVDAGCGVGFFSRTLLECEAEFVRRLLRRDMTVVDAGAHHGLYMLLASKRVGWDGRVIAIEPSPRECQRLEKHLRLNRCSNTALVTCALGEDPGEAELYLVDGVQDWCNSLRPPSVDEPVRTVRVPVRRLDDVLAESGVTKVDFMKLDVEGAELSVLYGAMKLLRRESRPAILAEVQDSRTEPWGYAAKEIIQFLIRMDYRWFAIAAKGALLPISCDQETYEANLVALPVERTEEFLSLLGQK